MKGVKCSVAMTRVGDADLMWTTLKKEAKRPDYASGGSYGH